MSETPADARFSLTRAFTAFANATSRVTGRPLTFVVCIVLILAWAVTGPMFHYSDTWQLIINTSTTIITFLMVFLIQNTQNRDGAAIQAKLDELIRVTQAKNHFIGIERLTDKELEHILDEMEEHSEPMPMIGEGRGAEPQGQGGGRPPRTKANAGPRVARKRHLRPLGQSAEVCAGQELAAQVGRIQDARFTRTSPA